MGRKKIDQGAQIIEDAAYKAELDKLIILFGALPENERAFIQPLLENAAFMRVTLDKLQQEIRKNGVIETYQNGAAQHGMKMSAAIQAYNQTMKTYHALMDKLIGRLPEEAQQDGLAMFRID